MKTKTYDTWSSMYRRCCLPSQRGFKDYGAREICIDPAWRKFEAFLADMGEQPDGLTLERRDPHGNYTRANCTWASTLQQARNKTTTRWLEHAGERLCLAEWAERLGIKPKTLRARLDDHGWTVERALSEPVMSYQESSFIARETRYGRKPNNTRKPNG